MLFFLVTKLAMLSHLSVCPQVSIVLVVGSIHDREAFARLEYAQGEIAIPTSGDRRRAQAVTMGMSHQKDGG